MITSNNNKEKGSKEDIEKRIVIVKQAIIELRENPHLIQKMEKVLAC